MMNIHSDFRPLADEEVSGASSAEDWQWVGPLGEDEPAFSDEIAMSHAPHGFLLTQKWAYRNEDGKLLGYVVRIDKQATGARPEKTILPFTYCKGVGGDYKWRSKAWPEPRPLYGLGRLAANPDAPVLVVEGEKVADAADKRFPDHVVITSPGGSGAAGKADWTALKGRKVTIWPDNDDSGGKYADDVARLATEAGAASVSIVQVPATFPTKWDLADRNPEGITKQFIMQMLEAAKPAGDRETPIPLYPELPPSEPFPVDALGDLLAPAAKAIANKIQVPVSMAAQSVLAVAALAAQAHADVMMPYGQTRPLSLFFLTIAASGDRKTTADKEALRPVHERERVLKEHYDRELKKLSLDTDAYNAEHKRIENAKELDYEGRKKALQALGPPPEKPLSPLLTAGDPTIEGLLKAWITAPASLGLFSAEGGQFIGGYGMSSDNRLKTAAAYSELWDGSPVKRIRSLDGMSLVYGRRLSMHLMVQHEAARQFLADPTLRDQGLLSRFLVIEPDSIAGTRMYRSISRQVEAAIEKYHARILSILGANWPLEHEKRNELKPRALRIDSKAEADWRAFHDHIEEQCGRDGSLDSVRDFAAKAAEHAARIAGVLTIVGDYNAAEISKPAMRSAIRLMDWYVNEVVRFRSGNRANPKLIIAQKLLQWLWHRPGDITVREIVQNGPTSVRTKEEAEKALSVLVSHGWVEEVSRRPHKVRLKARL